MVRTVRRFLLPALGLLASVSALAQPAADPLRQPVCMQALERLKAEEDVSRRQGREGPVRPALAAARRQVAKVCLGGDDVPPASPPRAGIAPVVPDRPVIRVPPGPPPVAPVPVPRVAPPASSAVPRGPVVVGVCDPFGCWSQDGVRLPRAGPYLVGPRGLCTASGPFALCP